jgi:hypothetical protein
LISGCTGDGGGGAATGAGGGGGGSTFAGGGAGGVSFLGGSETAGGSGLGGSGAGLAGSSLTTAVDVGFSSTWICTFCFAQPTKNAKVTTSIKVRARQCFNKPFISISFLKNLFMKAIQKTQTINILKNF